MREIGLCEDDERLVRDCLSGQANAFESLVLRYQARLFSAVSRVISNVEDCQDVVQEAFLHAYQHLASFKGDAQFFTWLYRIAMNAAISLRRKRKPALRIVGPDGESVIDPADQSDASQPSHALDQTERERVVKKALSRCSAEHRAVLVMKDMEGMKYEEMAEVLGVPVGTIRSRLHRARLELREILERAEAEGEAC
jgi:RNA polymerase sigma-70 factor (ECF subfamily)